MKAEEVIEIIRDAIKQAESEAFDATVKACAEAGYANPCLQAQNEWQGHDNQVRFGTIAEALETLDECGSDGGEFDADEWEDGDTPETRLAHLAERFSRDGEIGTGDPLAYVGVDGYWTLIREGATRDQIGEAATDCLPADDYEPSDEESDE